MALAALDVYRQAVGAAAPEIRADLAHEDPFDPGTLRLVPGVEESKRLNHPAHPCILLSASGMATGGRVVHHLAALAPDPRNLILLPGFQVAGTRGRALQDGARAVKIFGSYVPVRARVATLDEYSAHADADQVLRWLSSVAEPPRTCFVVHGEPAAAQRLADRIDTELGWCAVVPRLNERVRIAAREADR
jgi:metallo-beta-lactamase family protein